MRVLMLHGWGGSDYPHWQAKLACKLACNYRAVSFPLLKNPHFPKKDDWLAQLDEQMRGFKPNIVLCHSLANTLWFWYTSRYRVAIDKLYLVAMPSLSTHEKTINSFFPAPKPQRLGAKEVFVVSSDNDKWCDPKEAEEIAKEYGANFSILEGAGHINSDSGYGEWEWIFEQFDLKHKCEE
ncbi:MAG TPA: serine hydrolase family protein [Nitratifractor sp.]|nr:serine hydrolase family protein [Nitratifractor sp.]